MYIHVNKCESCGLSNHGLQLCRPANELVKRKIGSSLSGEPRPGDGKFMFFPLRSGFFWNSWLWKMMNMDHLFGWSRWFIHWKSGDSDRSAISWLHVFMSCGELIGSIWMIYVYRYTTTKVISDGGIWTSPKHRHGMWHFFANNDLFTLITS